MKRPIFLLIVAIIGMACGRSLPQDQAGYEKQKLANEVRRKAASRLQQEVALRPCGTIGQMLNASFFKKVRENSA